MTTNNHYFNGKFFMETERIIEESIFSGYLTETEQNQLLTLYDGLTMVNAQETYNKTLLFVKDCNIGDNFCTNILSTRINPNFGSHIFTKEYIAKYMLPISIISSVFLIGSVYGEKYGFNRKLMNGLQFLSSITLFGSLSLCYIWKYAL